MEMRFSPQIYTDETQMESEDSGEADFVFNL